MKQIAKLLLVGGMVFTAPTSQIASAQTVPDDMPAPPPPFLGVGAMGLLVGAAGGIRPAPPIPPPPGFNEETPAISEELSAIRDTLLYSLQHRLPVEVDSEEAHVLRLASEGGDAAQIGELLRILELFR